MKRNTSSKKQQNASEEEVDKDIDPNDEQGHDYGNKDIKNEKTKEETMEKKSKLEYRLLE